MAPGHNAGFLRQCAGTFREVHFADPATGRIYLRLESGVPAWADADALAVALADPETRAGIEAIAPSLSGAALPPPDRPRYLGDSLAGAPVHTLGRWGAAMSG